MVSGQKRPQLAYQLRFLNVRRELDFGHTKCNVRNYPDLLITSKMRVIRPSVSAFQANYLKFYLRKTQFRRKYTDLDNN